MRDVSLRWGLGMGAASAILGTAALIAGSFIEPVQRITTAEAAALAIFVRGILVLVTLGIALGLAYYAGLRAERARLSEDAAAAAPTDARGSLSTGTSTGDIQNQRRVAVLAGGLTMFCYWLITSLYLFVLPPSTQPSTAQVDVLSFIENRLLFGIIFVLFGLGLGGLGGRAPAARVLLDRIIKSPVPAPVAVAATVPTGAALAPANTSVNVVSASTTPSADTAASDTPAAVQPPQAGHAAGSDRLGADDAASHDA